MFKPLEGRTVIVTGASKGIGRGIAKRFGAVGCSVLVVARTESDAGNVAKEIAGAGGKASAFAADVSDEASMSAMAAEASKRYGRIDILCANAGIFPAAKLDAMTVEDFDNVIATNLRGTFLAVRACLAELKKARGRIIVTSSITGPITGYPGWSHYGASKAGQLGFIRTAAIELAPFGVTINAVMPGNIATEGLSGLGPEYIAKMESSIPMKRLGTVDDIANAALYFASDEAAYVTGQTLVIDGGQILPESLMALEEMSKP
jgi:3-oxoacyl-[acyl-carrier protein] reductase